MEVSLIQSLFREFMSQYNSAHHSQVWEAHKQAFKRFWNDKILNEKSELSVADTDAVIRLLDTKGRGRQRTDESVATTGIRQDLWERLFDTLRAKQDIRQTMTQIFGETDDSKLIELINRLGRENKNNKNGLTGESAVAANALLFINDPARFLSMVSLSHRFKVMQAFGLGSVEELRTFGERVILSNRRIIDGFRGKYGLDAVPRALSEFLYTPHSGYTTNAKVFWQGGEVIIIDQTEDETEEPPVDPGEVEFALEKHLEEFLIRNWERTELGKRYELYEEDGELVSPQYRTEVGVIDLLVKDRETKQFVVIELKKGQTSDETVGQVARYKGWVARNLAGGGPVKGIIIARANDLKLQYAVEAIPDVELFVYKVSFSLSKAPGL